jgi:hypothetical protein
MIVSTLIIGGLIGAGIIFLISPSVYSNAKKDVDTISYNNTTKTIQNQIINTASTLSNFTSPSDSNYTFNPESGDTYYIGADGHKINLVHNSKTINPTYDQMVSFICQDTTNERPYIPESYTCGDFAETVQNNAENAGYKCAWISIDLQGGEGHACNAFNTSDRGVVFVDCTGGGISDSDAIVYVNDGSPYTPKPISGSSNIIYSSMGTVKDYTIFWDNETQTRY